MGDGFVIIIITTCIAYMRISKSNDLAGIRGISSNFLIARHSGIKTNLAQDFAFLANTGT